VKRFLDGSELYKELDADTKAARLSFGVIFESLVDAARDWETKNP
jgi:hypothetical protein